MKQHRGYYSLIQFCPDPRRLEAANVGVVLFSPELRFCELKINPDLSLVTKIFGAQTVDKPLVEMAQRTLRNRLMKASQDWRDAEDLLRFAKREGNDLLLTAPQTILASDFSKELDTLFAQLVATASKPKRQPRTKKPNLKPLGELLLEGIPIEENVEVEIPGLGSRTFDYAFQNGAYNLVESGAFSRKLEDAQKKAQEYAVSGNLLFQESHQTDNPKKLIVVANFADTLTAEAKAGIEYVLEQHHTRLVPGERLPDFVEEVRQTAHL